MELRMLKHTCTRLFRSRRNVHRYFYFLEGKLRSFQTHEKDFLFNPAQLSGCLNQLSTATTIRHAAAVVLLLGASLLAVPQAHALPTGYQSVAGDVQFNPAGNTLNITTQAQRSVADYNTFNIQSHETVNFNLPNASAAILNRVVGGSPSRIHGAMNANGQVFLVNPGGIVFGQGATVNVGSLFASTLPISNAAFLNNTLTFSKDPNAQPAAVMNEGQINVSPDGFAVLAGSAVKNTGSIIAPGGQIHMVAGDQVTARTSDVTLVDLTVDKALQSKVEGYQAAVANAGTLVANGGLVRLQADLARSVYQQAVNNSGRISAQAVRENNGKIELLAKSKSADAIVHQSGVLDASGLKPGERGGSVTVTGDHIALAGNSVITVSGDHGGGTVLVGGNYQGNGPMHRATNTFVGSNAKISADAVTQGNGGQVVLWSDGQTRFYGDISAKGGAISGNGGQVEVSGVGSLVYNGQVNTLAPNGQTGTLLLDPTDIRVVSASSETGSLGDVDNFEDPDSTATPGTPTDTRINVTALNNAASNVVLQASRDIQFQTAVNMTQSGVGLSAQAGRNIEVNGAINTNNGSVSLTADAAIPAGTSGFPAGVPSDGIGRVVISSPIAAGTGDITLTGSDVTVNGTLTGNNVFLTANQANGSIAVNRAVTASGSITAAARHNILINNAGPATGKLTATGSGNIILRADSDNSLKGSVIVGERVLGIPADADAIVANNGDISLRGENVILYSSVRGNNITAIANGAGDQGDISVSHIVEAKNNVVLAANNDLTVLNYSGTGLPQIRSTVDGSIILLADTDLDDDGTLFIGANNTVDSNIALLNLNGDIFLQGSRIRIANRVDAGNNTITVTPAWNKPIQVGNGVFDTPAAIGISGYELSRLSAGTVNIGTSAVSGDITVAADIDLTGLPGGGYNLNLNTPGQVTVNPGVSINTGSRTLQIFADNGITLGGGITAGSLIGLNVTDTANIIQSATGSLALTDSNGLLALQLGNGNATLTGTSNNAPLFSAFSSGGSVSYTSATDVLLSGVDLGTGSLTLNILNGGILDQVAPVVADSLSVDLSSGSIAFLSDLSNDVNTFAANSSDGTVFFIDADDVAVGSTDLGLSPTSALFVSSGGALTVQGPVTAGSMLLQTFNPNASVQVNNTVSGLSAVTLFATGGGAINLAPGVAVSTADFGTITLVADQMSFDSATLNAGATGGRVVLAPQTVGADIAVGGATITGALDISDAELAAITANTVQIGNETTSGTITIDTIDFTGKASDLLFNTLGSVQDATPGSDTTANIVMGLNRSVTFTGGWDPLVTLDPLNASVTGAAQLGQNSVTGDLDILVSGTGVMNVKVVGFTGTGATLFDETTAGGGAYINLEPDDTSDNLVPANLLNGSDNRSALVINNEIKSNGAFSGFQEPTFEQSRTNFSLGNTPNNTNFLFRNGI